MRGLPIATELSAAELRALARRETRLRVAPRLYAIVHVLDGVSRAEAARLCGMDRQGTAKRCATRWCASTPSAWAGWWIGPDLDASHG